MQKAGGKTGATYKGPDFSVYPGEHIKQSCADYFEAILAEMQRRADIAFRHFDPEKRRELIQETVCVAYKDMLRCLRNGKRFTPCSLTYYATLHVKCGNYHNGVHVQDAMSEGARIKGRSAIEGLTEGLIDQKVKLPSEQVRVKLDYSGFLRKGKLTQYERRAFALFARGYRPKEIADRLNVSKCYVSYLRHQLERKLIRFFGKDIAHA